ncbi:hypothetical protein ONZ51_g12488 [Trametes cubensis]|uniref:Uncharacterized protein n=1 Tax=Trametes cubensis TaxID=1111947 RepID=A0AAD7TI71_9APHY|nr:hypothetical protein ONZ51_g12488 [Trametes cubensis]
MIEGPTTSTRLRRATPDDTSGRSDKFWRQQISINATMIRGDEPTKSTPTSLYRFTRSPAHAMDAFFTIAPAVPVESPPDVPVVYDGTGTNGDHGSCTIAW